MAEDHLINLQPGTVIAGRYEVVKCIGAGSMGVAYACRDRELGGYLKGLKVLFPEVAQDKVASARFRNEIFASYRVSHPNVVRAYDYIRDGDLVAYTMEYVGGGDLATRMGRGKDPFPITDAVKLLSQMCAGVQAIHDAEIVHRDLKPENILLTKDNQVKIADFGIARVDKGQKLTEHGGVVGTIDYVSPEYMLNSHVDWRSDIYALGILAYEMVTGELPFRGESVYAAMTKRLKSDARAPSQMRSDCPVEFDRIILRMMARDPQQRYQSAVEVLADLQKFGASIGVPISGAITLAKTERYVGPTVPSENEPTGTQPQPQETVAEDSTAGANHSPSVLAGNQSANYDRVFSENSPDRNARKGPRLGPARAVSAPDSSRYSQRPSANPRSSAAYSVSPRQSQERSENAGYSAASGATQSETRDQAYDMSYDPLMVNELDDDPYLQRLEDTDHSAAPYPSSKKPGSDSGRPAWLSPAAETPTITANTGQLQKLSQLTGQGQSSIWVDVVILIATVVIGLGFGFACVNFLFPGGGTGSAESSISSSSELY